LYLILDTTIPVIESDEDDVDFDEIPVEQFEELSDSDIEESLEQAVRNMNEKVLKSSKVKQQDEQQPTLNKYPEVVDDYIRNYLSSKGLLKSLDAFQVSLV
jgi:hypothetical protein